MYRRLLPALFLAGIVLTVSSCSPKPDVSYSTAASVIGSSETTAVETTQSETIVAETTEYSSQSESVTKADKMIMKINEQPVEVLWEDNGSVEALKEMAKEGPVVIKMSKYGGFEQVGSLGKTLPAKDKRIKTAPGDIVLYSRNQIVVFYGSNTWEYTKLGKITGKSKEELKKLLGSSDVTLTISFD